MVCCHRCRQTNQSHTCDIEQVLANGGHSCTGCDDAHATFYQWPGMGHEEYEYQEANMRTNSEFTFDAGTTTTFPEHEQNGEVHQPAHRRSTGGYRQRQKARQLRTSLNDANSRIAELESSSHGTRNQTQNHNVIGALTRLNRKNGQSLAQVNNRLTKVEESLDAPPRKKSKPSKTPAPVNSCSTENQTAMPTNGIPEPTPQQMQMNMNMMQQIQYMQMQWQQAQAQQQMAAQYMAAQHYQNLMNSQNQVPFGQNYTQPQNFMAAGQAPSMDPQNQQATSSVPTNSETPPVSEPPQQNGGGMPQNQAQMGFQNQAPMGFQNQAQMGFQNQAPMGFQNQAPMGFQNQAPMGFQNMPNTMNHPHMMYSWPSMVMNNGMGMYGMQNMQGSMGPGMPGMVPENQAGSNQPQPEQAKKKKKKRKDQDDGGEPGQ
ncbi:hypothetical protein Slin15195_G064210 [Septoria linicola]|uniref:Uncharacterized protein n=1 Tax=Septoria linicola TaxID=215465 RepID=A0A9Q9EKB7_9PEZI|nr:hypothetical protein Slin15195_G064210 [Septoria linicola]